MALTDTGDAVKGKVDRVLVKVDPKDENKRQVRVHVGTEEVHFPTFARFFPEVRGPARLSDATEIP